MDNVAISPSPTEEDVCAAFPEPKFTLEEAATLPNRLQLKLAAWLRLNGQFDRAEVLLDQLETLSGSSAGLLDERAALALDRGDVAAVQAIWQRRLAEFPAPSAKVSYGRALIELGQIDAAGAVAEDLLSEHGELATAQPLSAELALHQGDPAPARAFWSGQLADDPTRVAPLLALCRVAVISGDVRGACDFLDRALADVADLAAAQLASAAGLAELLGRPARSRALRLRYARLEASRAISLAAEIDAALGRPPDADRSAPPERSGHGMTDRGKQPASSAEARETPATEFTPTADEQPKDSRVLPTLREVFGYETLRHGQGAVINRVLAGRDTLAILPTGAGKSLTFQLSSLLLPGTTLVISPLIALMKDQVEGLPPVLRERTVLVNSTLSPAEQQRALEGIAAGSFKLVYAAPERLRQYAFLRALRQAGVSLVVVDEAHCISLWGHDFRPDYLTIPSALPELGNPPLLAITATATPRMERAISGGFDREFDHVRTSVFRPNLHYEVHRLPGREQKVAKVLEICREERGSGIVYVSSRKDAVAIAALLRDRGVGAIPYHAGLDPETRARNQERFMTGRARVVVATVAFGMGVDKRDVRFIVHLNPPRSLEAYAQESGRAGRDGLPARCVLLIAPSDQASLNRLARRDEQSIDTLRGVYTGVKRASIGRWAVVDPGSLLPHTDHDEDVDEAPDPRIALGLLEQADLLRRRPDAPVSYTLTRLPLMGDGNAKSGEGDARFAQLAAWAGFDDPGRDRVTIRTAAACEVLGITPLELGRLLASQPDLTVQEGPRLVCLELLPVSGDAGARLNQILARARQEARRRIQQVMAYATGHTCRHVALAAHLGEVLEPCGAACDNCLEPIALDGVDRAAKSDTAGAARPRLTADDAFAVLNAVRTLPFPMGKTGLARLLLGSVESRVRADRSESFGALSAFKKGKIESLIDRLVEDGFLFRDLEHEYKLISLTERGAAAGPGDLAAYDEEVSGPRAVVGNLEAVDEAQLSPGDRDLLQRLHAWRRDRASRDAVPPYVVAHNSSLIDMAQYRPQSLDELTKIKGYGQARAEKYGEEIIAIIAEAAGASERA